MKLCSQCGEIVKGIESRCPRCGQALLRVPGPLVIGLAAAAAIGLVLLARILF